jgi:hypothetical protein
MGEPVSGSHRLARRAIGGLVVALVVGGALTWHVVRTSCACQAVRLHAPPAAETPAPPPIGGPAHLVERLRRAYRPERSPVVYCLDFADPFVLVRGDEYLAYPTNTATHHVPVLHGGNLFSAPQESEALPVLPAWSTPGRVWAPAVAESEDGYLLYSHAVRVRRRGAPRHRGAPCRGGGRGRSAA